MVRRLAMFAGLMILGVAGLGGVGAHFQDTQVDPYYFVFYDSADDVMRADITNQTIGFVVTAEMEEWTEGELRTVFLKNNRGLTETYSTCWHEVKHWENHMQYGETPLEQEHSFMEHQWWVDPYEPACVDLVWEGFVEWNFKR